MLLCNALKLHCNAMRNLARENQLIVLTKPNRERRVSFNQSRKVFSFISATTVEYKFSVNPKLVKKRALLFRCYVYFLKHRIGSFGCVNYLFLSNMEVIKSLLA
ncbi:hypothetical protein GU3_14740 [Oceanimonas sp. GK1]|nr:hypothetical protein GU3_14740 [Oceanimonas sp. GK1]